MVCSVLGSATDSGEDIVNEMYKINIGMSHIPNFIMLKSRTV